MCVQSCTKCTECVLFEYCPLQSHLSVYYPVQSVLSMYYPVHNVMPVVLSVLSNTAYTSSSAACVLLSCAACGLPTY